ncbi:hypothetical protein WM03_14960 [Burkholderia ubonensis]|nr:hypothetical protein WI74_32825 [Burkholderia ubonensis]KVN52043.1 hypothetical protein WJ65_30680 [Burkholderia ubonensis]KWI15392.1 hypothetical protein WM02_12045 [Burkholderia ubonensis]KWI29428.1 hypothetical protein WM03_14960 [Burkholderia ubonensis]ODQ39035.1 hypothetical protein BGV63_14535 [Burkholderia ubonensis]
MACQMMKNAKRTLIGAVAMMAAACAHAFEFEDAVPLTIGAMQRNARPSDIDVSLDGKTVTVAARLRNETHAWVKSGFYAYTPLFHRLGAGEEHDDKRFSSLTVAFDGTAIPLVAERRAFFLGKDVTGEVRAAGLDTLPSEERDPAQVARIKPQLGMKLEDGRDWEGFVSYSWVVPASPDSTGVMTIRYQALPQFSLEEVTSARFARLVEQHCGDAARVTQRLRAMETGSGQILVQRYVVPVSFMNRSPVKVSLSQPSPDWMGGQPLLSLVCGLTSRDGAALPATGTIDDADAALSILVISRPAR